MARIEVEVVGKDQGLTATLDKANNAAIATGKSIEKTSQTFYVAGKKITTTSKSIAEQVQKASAASAQLAAQAQKTGAVLGGAAVAGSNRAAFALTNLGRVAQDAPFGFIGIQNNLNPLLESFTALRKETGSAGAAFRALGKSLIGPAGIGIALSVVSAAILFYQQYQQRANKATTEAKKTTDDYIQSLEGVTQARLKGAQSAQSELTTLRVLYARTQDLTLSQEQRQKAVDQLQEKYPAYFKNIKDEAILAGNAKSAYDQLSTAILASAKARAAADLVAENSKRQLTDIQRLRDLEKQELDLNKQLTEAIAQKNLIESQGSTVIGGGAGNILAAGKVLDIEKQIKEVQKASNNLKTDYLILQNRNLDLVKEINVNLDKGGTLEGGNGKEIDENTKKLENFRDTVQSLALFDVSGRRQIGGLDGIVKQYEKTGAQLNTIPLIPIEGFKVQASAFLSEAMKFTGALNEIIAKGTVGAFEDFGESIGNALGTGGNLIEAATSSILSSIGGIVIQFGKLTLAAGIASSALSKALTNPINPLSGTAAIAAGIALIAVGAAVRGFANNIGNGSASSASNTSGNARGSRIPGFASGVTNFEGGMAYVHAGELLTNLPTGANVVPRAKTDRLLSGIGGTELVAETVLRGQDILVAIRRTERRNSNI